MVRASKKFAKTVYSGWTKVESNIHTERLNEVGLSRIKPEQGRYGWLVTDKQHKRLGYFLIDDRTAEATISIE